MVEVAVAEGSGGSWWQRAVWRGGVVAEGSGGKRWQRELVAERLGGGGGSDGGGDG